MHYCYQFMNRHPQLCMQDAKFASTERTCLLTQRKFFSLYSPKTAEDGERLTFKHRQGTVKYLPQVLSEMIWGRNKPIMSKNSKAGKRKTASHKERGGKKELCLEG